MRSHLSLYVQVSNEPRASAALYLTTEHSVHSTEDGCAEVVWVAWQSKKLDAYRESNSGSPARSLVSILTEAVRASCLYTHVYIQNHRITVCAYVL
jgi:hypothetical protein